MNDSFDLNVKFMFGMGGKIKFENNSNSEYDIMVHYKDEMNKSKTLYLHPNGRKFSRDMSQIVAFENEFIYKNEFTGNYFEVPIFCLTVYPIENRDYSKKSKEIQKEWNETVIKNLNLEFRRSYSLNVYKEYEEYYYTLDQDKRRTKINIPKQEGNFWNDKNKELENKKENKKGKYQGLSKLERTKKLIEEIEKLTILKKKLSNSDIIFNFKFESNLLNFDSENDS